jgi:hypothetical protein
MSIFERGPPAVYRTLLISSILVSLSGVSEKKAGSMPPANKMMLKTLANLRTV